MSIMGTRVVRREDPALLRGAGRYVADLTESGLDGAVCVSYVRSPFAHARILSIDASDALDLPGVLAVYTAADLDLADPRPRVGNVSPDTTRPWLAIDTVRFAGEPVAIVVTERQDQAEDAIEAVFVDYDFLDVVVDPMRAQDSDAPLLFPSIGTNVVCVFDPAEPDPTLFDGCDVVVTEDLVNQRLAACPLEGRATAAVFDAAGALTVWISSQGVHGAKPMFTHALGMDKSLVRLIAPDVGGGFGAKITPYPEDVLVPFVARALGRPARWVETRNENMLAMGHGRDQRHRITIGGDRNGRVLAYRLEITANAGAYPTNGGGFLPTFTQLMAPGTYDIARVEALAKGVVTNTMTVEAYRGAGRPEATAAIERAMDLFAAEVGMDAVRVRQINLLASHDEPFTTVTGAVYDCGNYHGALDAALAAAGYDELRAEQERRRASGDGPLLGIGVSTYVEITAGGGVPTEFGTIEMNDQGHATLFTGASPHGQGHHTVFASLVAEQLDIDPERVTVVHGDTALVPSGRGTMGSRSLQLGGAAAQNAAIELVELAKDRAAEHLEAAVEDIVMELGEFFVRGTPSRTVEWAELAAGADDRLLRAAHQFTAPGQTFPFGAHVAVVEVDRDTGLARLVRIVACDDAGRIINPLLADGQRHGGIAQGAAQALLEEVRYDDDGNPLTASFADYTIISAMELPRFELVSHETPTPYNPLGAKGIGESGTIGSTPAVQSAVIDAVAHLGVRHIDMPTTPERVWRAMTSSELSAGRSFSAPIVTPT